MNISLKKKIFIAIVFVFGVLTLYTINSLSFSSKINVVIAPSESKLTINGAARKAGIIRVKPGSYKITASLGGFSSSSQSVVVKKGQTKEIDIVLVSNSPTTSNWYSTHLADELIAEGISSRANTAAAAAAVQNTPLIKYLPFMGPKFEYRIDYGNNPGSSATIIYITAQGQQAQLDALAFIKSLGYDPATMTIQYINAVP